MKRTFTILVFNSLIVSLLFTPFAQEAATGEKPLSTVFFFIISVYAATIIIVSSYRVGRVVFNRASDKTLGFGFGYALIGYILLMFILLGYARYVEGFVSSEGVIGSIVLITSFVVFPMLAAAPNRKLLKAISRVTREF